MAFGCLVRSEAGDGNGDGDGLGDSRIDGGVFHVTFPITIT